MLNRRIIRIVSPTDGGYARRIYALVTSGHWGMRIEGTVATSVPPFADAPETKDANGVSFHSREAAAAALRHFRAVAK